LVMLAGRQLFQKYCLLSPWLRDLTMHVNQCNPKNRGHFVECILFKSQSETRFVVRHVTMFHGAQVLTVAL
jgi:hypothetical protein